MGGLAPKSFKVLQDGSIVVVGNFYDYTSNPAQVGLFTAKYDSSGAPAAGFGSTGIVLADYHTQTSGANWLGFSPVISIAASGKIYAYYGTNGEYVVRLNANGTPDLSFGTTGRYLGLYFASPLFSNANVNVKAFTVDETANPITATFFGVDMNSNPTKSSAVMYRLKFGSQSSGGNSLAELDTSYAGTTILGGVQSSTNGYARAEIPAFGMAARDVAFSAAGFAYIVAGVQFSTTNYLIAMDIAQRRPFTSFGTDGVLNLSSLSMTSLGAVEVISSGPDKIMLAGQDNATYKMMVAKFDQGTGALDTSFGNGGKAILSSCESFHSPAGLAKTSTGAIVLAGSTNMTQGAQSFTAPRIARLGSGSSTTQCGTTTTTTTQAPQNNNPNNNPNNTMPSNTPSGMLPTLTGTAVEVPGQGIKISVSNLAAGARIAVMVYDSAVPVLGSAAEVPWFTEGATGVSTLMVNSIKWTPNSNNISGNISRTDPLVAGVRYRVMYRQAIGSMNSMSSTSSQSVTTFITLTTDAKAAVAAPGVTVTDTKVYSTAAATPARVAAESAITVMTPAQAKVQEIVSMTPAVCLPNDDDIIFIDTGKCIAKFVNEKTGKVLRTLKTTVVADEVSSLNVGNEVAILAPIYFDAASSKVSPAGLARIKSIKEQVTAAGSVLLVGHSGILMGNTPENVALAKARATSTAKALKAVGAQGPFYATSAGALDPASNKLTVAAQAKNRRVVIVLVP
jgi:outer membrane protein OmpA-like peptidoglycan-associated protein